MTSTDHFVNDSTMRNWPFLALSWLFDLVSLLHAAITFMRYLVMMRLIISILAGRLMQKILLRAGLFEIQWNLGP